MKKKICFTVSDLDDAYLVELMAAWQVNKSEALSRALADHRKEAKK